MKKEKKVKKTIYISRTLHKLLHKQAGNKMSFTDLVESLLSKALGRN